MGAALSIAPACAQFSRSRRSLRVSASNASTPPFRPTRAARCVVLFPGAAQQSSAVHPGFGSSAAAGKHELLPCRISLPSWTIRWSCRSHPGGNTSRSGTCGSRIGLRLNTLRSSSSHAATSVFRRFTRACRECVGTAASALPPGCASRNASVEPCFDAFRRLLSALFRRSRARTTIRVAATTAAASVRFSGPAASEDASGSRPAPKSASYPSTYASERGTTDACPSSAATSLVSRCESFSSEPFSSSPDESAAPASSPRPARSASSARRRRRFGTTSSESATPASSRTSLRMGTCFRVSHTTACVTFFAATPGASVRVFMLAPPRRAPSASRSRATTPAACLHTTRLRPRGSARRPPIP